MKFNYYKLLFCFLLQKNRRSFCKRLKYEELNYYCSVIFLFFKITDLNSVKV